MLFGSFGSVILHRLGDNITRAKIRSVLVGRSHCPHCQHTLARHDLFPLVSRLFTRGKCRYC
ncbi:prepilin peptidase [Patescibacteria group bacterium]|nr:prepilin peptidase [Patescibacteria group bacterium]